MSLKHECTYYPLIIFFYLKWNKGKFFNIAWSCASFELRNLTKIRYVLKPRNRDLVKGSYREDMNICWDFWFIYFLDRVAPFLNLEIWPKFNIPLKRFSARNFSETAQQNFVKLCKLIKTNCVAVYVRRKFWSDFFPRELRPKYTIFCNLNSVNEREAVQSMLHK